ncbi:MAG: MotA/TolQ/ExbB proton channel family protein [Deltaproteobacteria bacterium]|nr:MotA/TolQ/ExbB proton channel family protein [Deltaproteobacteria bacterium]
MLELYQKGGVTMYVLTACSVVAVAVFVERMLALRSSRVAPRSLLAEVGELVRAGKVAEALARCVGSSSAAGVIFAAVLRKHGAPESTLKEAALDAGRREAARLERFVEFIGVVAALGPLLGLLGTVLGMIKVFQRVNEVGAGSPVEMAAGIWEALLATAFGLIVGIPALVMYRAVLARIDGLVLRLEDEAVALVEGLTSKQNGARDQGPPAV